MNLQKPLFFLILISFFCTNARYVHSDQFTYFDEKGKLITLEAKLLGENKKIFALEKEDGKIELVPQLFVQKRVISEGPEAITSEQMVELLNQQFDPEFLKTHIEEPFIIGLVLDQNSGAPKKKRMTTFLKQCGRFMKNIEKMFNRFAKKVDIELTPSRFPLVLLIFEKDEDFNQYAIQGRKSRGLAAGNISGFYSSKTNYLAIRLSECFSFEVPLHEAIHQQVYNRGVFNRLSPVPSWFNEGIATGFEGDGEKISGGPTRIHSFYSYLSQTAKKINWNDVIVSDNPFHGDVLAGDAYTHAWSLHWLLLTKYKKEYKKYINLLATKETLKKDSGTKRKEEFESVFGKNIATLQGEFTPHLIKIAKKQKFKGKNNTPGVIVVKSHLGEVLMHAVSRVDRGGQMFVKGKLRNISPLRPMSFVVYVTTNSGAFARWYVPKLRPKKVQILKVLHVNETLPNSRGGPSQSFRIFVESAPADSEKAKNWTEGKFILPVNQLRR